MLMLEDIELIKQLKHRYWRFLDSGAIDELRARANLNAGGVEEIFLALT